VNNPAEVAGLTLQVQHDDGFAAWLNGAPIGSANVAEPYTITTLASDHEVTAGETTLTPSASLLVAGNNVLAVQVFNATDASSDLCLDVQLTSAVDEAPTVSSIDPPPSGIVEALSFISVIFSENVTGVDATDLLINSVAATNVLQVSPREYQFNFRISDRCVTVAWIANPGITDLDGCQTRLCVDRLGVTRWIECRFGRSRDFEFMADNENGIEDEDGTRADWIEI
jgi:hypothetical protein